MVDYVILWPERETGERQAVGPFDERRKAEDYLYLNLGRTDLEIVLLLPSEQPFDPENPD